MSVKKHKECTPKSVSIGVISVSTTRSIMNDESGKWIIKSAQLEGHKILMHKIVKDNKQKIRKLILSTILDIYPNVLLITGGTGLTSKDVTIEAVTPIFSKKMPGFEHMFAGLSYKEIGSAAIMSRATAGIIGNTALFCMPGSKNACRLACKKLIFPELTHIVSHIIV